MVPKLEQRRPRHLAELSTGGCRRPSRALRKSEHGEPDEPLVVGLLWGLAMPSCASWCTLQRAPRERCQLMQQLAIWSPAPLAVCKPLVGSSNLLAGKSILLRQLGRRPWGRRVSARH